MKPKTQPVDPKQPVKPKKSHPWRMPDATTRPAVIDPGDLPRAIREAYEEAQREG